MPYADLSDQRQGRCRCVLGYSFLDGGCLPTPAYLPYLPPEPTLFSFSFSESDLRESLRFE